MGTYEDKYRGKHFRFEYVPEANGEELLIAQKGEIPYEECSALAKQLRLSDEVIEERANQKMMKKIRDDLSKAPMDEKIKLKKEIDAKQAGKPMTVMERLVYKELVSSTGSD